MAVGTPQAVTTTLTYEPTFNRIASLTDPLNHTTTFSYESQGNLTTVTNPLGQATTLTYNGSGQPVTIRDPRVDEPRRALPRGVGDAHEVATVVAELGRGGH